MISLLLLYSIINFQSDFKGFSSKGEALHYSKILNCDGYFSKDENGMTFFFPCASQSELESAFQEKEVEPKVTEIWDPEPSAVDPGDSFEEPPSDAIVLFSRIL